MRTLFTLYRTSLAGFSAVLLAMASAEAATITVRSIADAGGTCPGAGCTLRQAIATAVAGDTINFAAGIATIDLTSAELLINKNLTISGPGANLLTVMRSTAGGTPQFRIFHINGNFNVTLSGLTIANGSNTNITGGNGGGIRNNGGTLTLIKSTISGNYATSTAGGGIFSLGGTLNLFNSTISSNSASNPNSNSNGGNGGGIYNDGGTVNVINSTLSGNSASFGGGGGGIYNGSGTVNLTNSTISVNSATGTFIGTAARGGGIFLNSGTVNARNTIIAQNTASGTGPDFFGTLSSQGYNLIGNTGGTTISTAGGGTTTGNQLDVPAGLDPNGLQPNGGPTQTIALVSGSTAIEGGHSSGSNTDQRGLARPVDDPIFDNATGGDGSDIGAYEVQADQLPGCNNINRIVNNKNDDGGAGSLRFVIANVCAGSTITFAPNVTGAINLTSGELLLNKFVTINGPGANLLSVQRSAAAGNFRIVNITSASVIATISGLTIANGNTTGFNFGGGISNTGMLTLTNAAISGNSSGFGGGGIYNDFGGTLTIINSTISGNASGNVGGIFNNGTLNLTSSTVSGNMTSGNGGGIAAGIVVLTNSTISGNSAGGSGGGIFHNGMNGGSVRSRNTIIALNTAPTGPDVAGELTSENFNLIGDNSGAMISPAQFSDQIGTAGSPINPMLGQLRNNGGPTFTHALLAGSKAIDKGHSSGSTTDQRGVGYLRTINNPAIVPASGGDNTDIGAFEFGANFSVVSRKFHGAAPFDIILPQTGNAGIECRRNTGTDTTGPNVGRDHEVVLTFPTAVTADGASVTSNIAGDTPSATFSVNSNVVTVDLHNIANAPRRLTINLLNASDGTNTNNVAIPMAVLAGDTTGNGSVNSSDIGQTKSKSGQAVNASNFRTDVTVSGSINSSDIGLVKSKSGTSLP